MSNHPQLAAFGPKLCKERNFHHILLKCPHWRAAAGPRGVGARVPATCRQRRDHGPHALLAAGLVAAGPGMDALLGAQPSLRSRGLGGARSATAVELAWCDGAVSRAGGPSASCALITLILPSYPHIGGWTRA